MAKWLCLVLVLLGLSACGVAETPTQPSPSSTLFTTPSVTPSPQNTPQEDTMLHITVDGQELLATWEENPSAQAFRQLLTQGPITVEMEDYGGFEKVGALGTTIPRSDTTITTQPGDVILYQGNQITIYYGTNTWNFTRLAKIQDPSRLQDVLGDGSVSVTFSLS